MKKFLLFTFTLIFLLVFISCGNSSNKDKGDTGDTADSAADTGDTADSAADTGDTADSAADTGDSAPQSGCVGFSIDAQSFQIYQEGFYVGYVLDSTLGDSELVDEFTVEFYGDIAVASYDLGTGDNANYSTCTECVGVYQDIDEDYEKRFFQESGTLQISSYDPETLDISAVITAKLIEVTIDKDNNYVSVPVEGGACIEIEAGSFSTVCEPQCDGKVCGPDGCGGICGEGCGADEGCNAEQTACVPYECQAITAGEFFLKQGLYRSNIIDNAAGSKELEDTLRIEFYTTDSDGYAVVPEQLETGTYDLASKENSNYATCSECVMLLEDLDEDGYATKYYFQQKGTLNITDIKEGTIESKGNAGNLRLVEVEIDENYNSIQVPGGTCYEIEKIEWDTVCVPQCEGKVCGPDGCGGTCGEGCGIDEGCSEDQKSCVAYECTKITPSAAYELDAPYIEYVDWGLYQYYYDTTYTPSTGSDLSDIFEIAIFDALQTKTYNLEDTNTKDCDLCLLVYEDINEESGTAKRYFQQKGEFVLDSFDVYTGSIEASMSDIRLIEISIDADTSASAPVPGGKCIEIDSAQLALPAE